MKPSRRLQALSSAIFTEMNKRKRKLEQQGMKVIDLGIGSPDQPPAAHLIEALVNGVQNPDNYRYPTSEGSLEFRRTVTDWYAYRFGVQLNADDEVLSLMGSQDGLAHLALAWIDEGDVVLVPDPGYPIYAASVTLAGGEIYTMPLTAQNGYLPDLEAIPTEIRQRAKMMVLNYPNNPLAATADVDFFRQVVEFAKEYEIIVAHDMAYSELAFDLYKPVSFLEVEGAKEIGIEFNSLSKSFNLAGCRIAYVVGNAEIIRPLAVVKSNIDYGVFLAVQQVAIEAMRSDINGHFGNSIAKTYESRRDVLVDGLSEIGWNVDKPRATMFVWAKIPEGWSSEDFAFTLLERAGIVVIPGNAFGVEGEGYVRIALVEEENVLREVVQRIKESGIVG
ncbi:LL-diaminopimelate aminotransferase [Ammoniphilus sp. CFH 90114]|uniref:LL-diaminopimelate aminotransferase n=1 Tax=Ammoniphilus sp. CFH 90114 TaxID=2493665 RepID=UPI00100F7C7A|nr:LL-diaminopimelate aminotransferase [Ammoniphilus sp. CFH 90114]RXT13636.1 LL-diaminopimelate aminotransferase [Ammoniphilus sp. CFH 90114]